MARPCPDGEVLDRITKECRPPLKRGRKKTNASSTSKCPNGQVLDKKTKKCRPPLKRGRSVKNAPETLNATLDKYGFVIPVFKPKTYNDEKKYKQTSILAFSKKKSKPQPNAS